MLQIHVHQIPYNIRCTVLYKAIQRHLEIPIEITNGMGNVMLASFVNRIGQCFMNRTQVIRRFYSAPHLHNPRLDNCHIASYHIIFLLSIVAF